MAIVNQTEHTDCILGTDAVLRPNAAAVALIRQRDEVLKQMKRYEVAWAAASVVGLFRRFSWLKRFTLDLKADNQTGDEGQTYRTVSFKITDVVISLWPTRQKVNTMNLDVDNEASQLEAALEDIASEMYEALADAPEDLEDLRFTLKHDAIADLLETAGEVSGTEAAQRLFGELMKD